MDRVRFGRALGYGARHAAKSLVQAVDAATATTPARSASEPAPGPSGTDAPAAGTNATGSARPGAPVSTSAVDGFRPGTHRSPAVPRRRPMVPATHLRRSLGSPLARFSSVVWLQVTGTFFTVLALFLSQGLWRQRGAVHLPMFSPQAGKLYLHAAAFAVFAYFAISSFVRAHLRQRR